jgi:hypothetical protein
MNQGTSYRNKQVDIQYRPLKYDRKENAKVVYEEEKRIVRVRRSRARKYGKEKIGKVDSEQINIWS